jgi:acyl-CoA synthetase (NDP forming)
LSHHQSTAGDLVRALLDARRVAVIGASDDGGKASGRTLRYLLRYGYTGEVYPINPRRATVQGLDAFAGLEDVPAVPDLAVIVLPAAQVPDAVRACGRVGVPIAIVFAAGYAETGPDGARAQAQLVAVAREANVRLLGPNCVGAVAAAPKLTATFMTGLDQDRFTLVDDGVAFVSQSGAMGAFVLSMAQSTGLGLGRFVSTGNEADISFAEVVEGLVEEGSTKVILGYVEGLRDVGRMRSALQLARQRRVPVCLMKVGRTAHGAAAAQSHTGALAGRDAVYSGLFAQYGVIRATDLDHLLDVGRVFGAGRAAGGHRVTIVTISGGAGILMTDAAAELGLAVPRWDDEWAGAMAAVLPPFAAVRNPIDTTGAIATDQGLLRDATTIALKHPDTDVVLVMIGNLDREEEAVCDLLTDAAATSDKPLVVVWAGGSGRPAQILGSRGIPVYPEPLRAMRAVSALVRWSGGGRTADHADAADAAPSVGDTTASRVLDEVAAKTILRGFGIPTVAEREAHDADSAAAAATELGFPVVLKLLSTQVAHKSDQGFVRVGLTSPDGVREAARELLEAARDRRIDDRRLVVQAFVPSSTELILGMRQDPAFGPVIALGLGGVLTEVAADVQVRLPPLTAADVESMVAGLRYRALLTGVRGRTPADLEALTRTVLSFVDLVLARGAEFESFEVNPLLIDGAGQPVAVDALAVARESDVRIPAHPLTEQDLR